MPPAIAHAIGELYIGASEIAQGRAGIARDMAPPHEFSDAFATMVAFEIGNEVDKRAARSDRRQLPRIAHQITRPDRLVERHSALANAARWRSVGHRWRSRDTRAEERHPVANPEPAWDIRGRLSYPRNQIGAGRHAKTQAELI